MTSSVPLSLNESYFLPPTSDFSFSDDEDQCFLAEWNPTNVDPALLSMSQPLLANNGLIAADATDLFAQFQFPLIRHPLPPSVQDQPPSAELGAISPEYDLAPPSSHEALPPGRDTVSITPHCPTSIPASPAVTSQLFEGPSETAEILLDKDLAPPFSIPHGVKLTDLTELHLCVPCRISFAGLESLQTIRTENILAQTSRVNFVKRSLPNQKELACIREGHQRWRRAPVPVPVIRYKGEKACSHKVAL